MHRLAPGYVDSIAKAFDCIPQGIRDRLRGVDFLCGVDPMFAGLHRYEKAADGRAYNNTAHVAWLTHQSIPERDQRKTTVVLPTPRHPSIIIHELGHALHESIHFDHDALPISTYARKDRWEAFAEAFRGWCGWYYKTDHYRVDLRTAALFDRLAA